MKRTIFIVFILISTTLFAQQYLDVVYLKNGSIIRGSITEQIPNETIRIESQGNVFVFKFDEIEKITKEPLQTNNSRSRKKVESREPEKSGLQKGYCGIAELGFGIAYGDNIDHANESIKLNVVNGYRFNPHIAVGLSTGARFLMRDDITLIPFMADLRINFIDRKASPFIALDLGSVYDATDNFASYGTMLGFGVGGAIKLSEKKTFNIGVSYEAIGGSSRDYFMSDVWTGKYRSFRINMGFTF